jgi:signal transduction histidine kinase
MTILKNSLKNRITLVIIGFVVSSLLIFAIIMVQSVNERFRPDVRPEDIYEIIQNDPEFGDLPDDVDKRKLFAFIGNQVREQERQRLIQELMIGTIVLMVVSGLIGYYISYHLTRPLKQISEDINNININSGGITELPNRSEYDEMQILVSRFNELLSEVRESMESQERFVQDASHELRTPLAAIQANLQLLQEKGEVTSDEYKSTFELVSRVNTELIEINNQLLFLERKDKSNKQAYKVVNLRDLVEDVLEEFTPRINQEGVEIKTKIEGTYRINCNPVDIARAIRNIIDNSLKYSGSKSLSLIISLTKDMDFINLQISDNGKGLSSSELIQVTERFRRGKGASTVPGSGLGLSIVQKIVDEHDGRLQLKSNQGDGLSVEIVLPKAK